MKMINRYTQFFDKYKMVILSQQYGIWYSMLTYQNKQTVHFHNYLPFLSFYFLKSTYVIFILIEKLRMPIDNCHAKSNSWKWVTLYFHNAFHHVSRIYRLKVKRWLKKNTYIVVVYSNIWLHTYMWHKMTTRLYRRGNTVSEV